MVFYFIYRHTENVKVDLLNSTMTQEIEKLNNANNMTDNAFTSLKALSVGMQTKLAVLKENAEVNRIFSRYKFVI